MPMLDDLLFCFSLGTDDKQSYWTDDKQSKLWLRHDHARIGDEKISMNGGTKFNDIRFYEKLWKLDGCLGVDLAGVCVYQEYSVYKEMRAVYRVAFRDGRTELREHPGNILDKSGVFLKKTLVSLEADEYITGIIVSQCLKVYAVTFVTNKRQVQVGDQRGYLSKSMTDNPAGFKIIAFCGSNSGVHNRFGFYMKGIGWQTKGTHILMRQLVKKSRAQLIPKPDLASTIQGLLNLDDGVFRNILSYL